MLTQTSAEALHHTWGENNQKGARARTRTYPIFNILSTVSFCRGLRSLKLEKELKKQIIKISEQFEYLPLSFR